METSHVKCDATRDEIVAHKVRRYRGGEPWTAQGVYWEEKEAMVCVR